MSLFLAAGVPEGVDARAWLLEHYAAVRARLAPPPALAPPRPALAPKFAALARKFAAAAPPPPAPQFAVAARIVAACAAAGGLNVAAILGSRRTPALIRPRFAAALLMHERLRLSLPEIGRRLGGRDHTTIINAIRRAVALRRDNPDFAAFLYGVEALIGPIAPRPKPPPPLTQRALAELHAGLQTAEEIAVRLGVSTMEAHGALANLTKRGRARRFAYVPRRSAGRYRPTGSPSS